MLNKTRKISHSQQRRRLHIRLKHKVNNRRHTQFIQEMMGIEQQQGK